jgi:hypothetical protein
LSKRNLLTVFSLLMIFSAQARQSGPELISSHPAGFYDNPITVSLTASAGAKIYYTLDGNKPGPTSERYTEPITINETTVIRAVVISHKSTGALFAFTFFIGEPRGQFPVISLSAPPGLLFDPVIGLFMTGNNLRSDHWKKPGANFWSKKELVAHAEIFEPDGQAVFNSPIGMRMFGGMSRLAAQKSLAIVARAKYGEKRIRHRLFGKNQPKSYKFLVLRNAGSDFGKAHFRDALMTGLLHGVDMDKGAYRPAHTYINGTYWGIYNIREKINRYFIEDHHPYDKDSIDLLYHRHVTSRGSNAHYLRMLRFLDTCDMGSPANYAWINTQMDVSNFMNYQIAQIYFDNQDAGGNIKFWRPRTPDGRWRWILYDTDWGFGLHDRKAYRNNSLAFHTEENGPLWPNPPWSTFILRKLLQNPDFKAAFINRFNDHLNTTFHPNRVLAAIEEKYQLLLPEIDRHLDRWLINKQRWESQVDILREFARKRPAYVRQHLKQQFNLDTLARIHIASSPGGRVILNDFLSADTADIKGWYFTQTNIQLKAVPNPGYLFSHWEGYTADQATNRFVTLTVPDKPIYAKAVFRLFTHPLTNLVVINELCPSNKASGDWIELHNTTKQKVDISEWVIADSLHEAIIPKGTVIGPKDYAILTRQEAAFRKTYPQAHNVIECMTFGLNKKGESIAIYTKEGALIDKMKYQLPDADETYTLGLLRPTFDSENPINWERKPGPGTPAAANPYFVMSTVGKMQQDWLEMGIASGILLIGLLLLFLRLKGMLF